MKRIFISLLVMASMSLSLTFTLAAFAQPRLGPEYAVIHYHRDDGDYGDHTTGNYNDFWGLHLWGDIEATIEWTSPKPFLGEDEYGRFAWVKLSTDSSNVGFIVHRGEIKDGTDADRFINPTDNPEIWLKSGDANIYTSQAEAQGFVTIHYHRDDGDYGDPTSDDFYDFWGIHLWGNAISPSEITSWTDPKRFDDIDDYGSFFTIQLQDASQPVNFILHRGDQKDPDNSPDRSFIPLETATVWLKSGDTNEYSQRGAAENFSTLHYHRPLGDYGDFTSNDFNDFWGLHTWGGAPDPGWTTPIKPETSDVFGLVFRVDLIENAAQMGYILHRGDTKDPGPDQIMTFSIHGYEVWQLQGANPDRPYVLPILVEVNNPPSLTIEETTININEGQIAVNGGAVSDADNDAVTLSASIGIVVNNNDGTWNWSFTTSDGPDDSQTVIITGDDSNGGNAQVTFDLTVNNVAPTINSVSNDSPIIEGTSVNIDVDASDPAGVNDPLSYSFDCDDDGFFEIGPQVAGFATCTFNVSGNFTINIQVTDDDGDVDLDSTLVIVLTPQQGIDDFLISEVEDLVDQGDLSWGQGNSLIKKLSHAITLLNMGNKTAAINVLQAFINQVNDLISDEILSQTEGQTLIDAANLVINTIIA